MEEIAMPPRVEERIETFGVWYREEKAKIWSLVYHNAGSFLQEFVNPFRSWTKSHYISTETDLTDRSIKKLQVLFPHPSSKEIETLRLISLTAKNRAETISSKSDFYPIYAAVVSAGVAAISLAIPGMLKALPVIGALVLIVVSAVIRMKTREQAAYLKEISNLIDRFV